MELELVLHGGEPGLALLKSVLATDEFLQPTYLWSPGQVGNKVHKVKCTVGEFCTIVVNTVYLLTLVCDNKSEDIHVYWIGL